MLPKVLVRLIHEMIPVEQVDEIAQIINYIMFSNDQLKFYHYSDEHREEAFVRVKHHTQKQIAMLGNTTDCLPYFFGVFVDKANIYFEGDRRTIVGIYDGLLENNFSVDTTINYKLPIREHIYSIAKIISKGIDSFKELYDEQFEIEYFGKNFTTIPVVEYLCERRPFDDEITFEQLCVIFSP